MSKIQIQKVKDKTDSFYTIKHSNLFNLPFRLIINGASQRSGKSTVILNLLLKDEGYNKDFKGENIYVISNNKLDNKLKILKEQKDIPDENIMEYDEEMLESLYELLEEEFIEAVSDNKKPPNVLIIFEDVAYSGNLKNKQSGIISKLICNGRHVNISQIYVSQKLSLCSTILRTNANAAILFSTTKKELDCISEDFNYLKTKKAFFNMFYEATKKRNQFLAIDLNNDVNDMYFNSNFEKIHNN